MYEPTVGIQKMIPQPFYYLKRKTKLEGLKMPIPTKFLKLILCCTILVACVVSIPFQYNLASATPSIEITATTNKPSYYIREEVEILGNFTQDGSPVPDALIAIEVLNPVGYPVAYRTIPIGDLVEEWAIEITDYSVRDMEGDPIESAKIDTEIRISVTIQNTLKNQVPVVITATVYDENPIPLCAKRAEYTMPPNGVFSPSWAVYIPEWARPGRATVYFNVYDEFPQNGGTPHIPETSAHFYITRNPELGIPYAPPKSTYTTFPGNYSTFFKLSPDRIALPDTYSTYVTGRKSQLLKTSASTTFSVRSDPCPPEASFTYIPLKAYQNMSVTLDASSSSAEGYNDTIIRYEWNIHDPNDPRQIIEEGNYTHPPSPLASHTFEYDGRYLVELNVTDNEGLWATASKQVIILPEFGPTANFTWVPTTPIINQTVTFDASNSTRGWSARTQRFSPITSYEWNFSDGTGIISTPNPTINHNFTQPENYTVTLKVTDDDGRSHSTSDIIQVLNITLKTYDVNGDGLIDIKDIVIVALHYGCAPGDACWDPRADVNGDDFIDTKDIVLVALHYGEDP